MSVNVGPSAKDRKAVAEGLSKLLADSYAVYLKTHGYHWNVRGPNFSQLHSLFMTQYTEMWTAIDEVAERIRALGELAPQSASAFANLTSIKDGDPEKDSSEMLKELIKDHGVVISTARAALDAADEVGDEASVDLMTQRLAAHEKAAWMLRSSLGDR